MKSKISEEIEFLRGIRGRFQDSKSKRTLEWIGIMVFGASAILFFSISFLSPTDSTADHLFSVLIGLSAAALAVTIWTLRAVEYEFTGEEIIERRARPIRNRIRFSDLTETRVLAGRNQMLLKTPHSKMRIYLVPSLKDAFREAVKTSEAKQSEKELRQLEKEKLAFKRRMKKLRALYAVFFILFVTCILCYIILRAREHTSHGFLPAVSHQAH